MTAIMITQIFITKTYDWSLVHSMSLSTAFAGTIVMHSIVYKITHHTDNKLEKEKGKGDNL
jgi:hypothetical protein